MFLFYLRTVCYGKIDIIFQIKFYEQQVTELLLFSYQPEALTSEYQKLPAKFLRILFSLQKSLFETSHAEKV